MFFDWLSREGGAIVSWWLLTALAGVAALPLVFRLMQHLPSRGYPLARAAGLMLVGFVFWLGNNLGLFRNNAGSVIVAWLIVLIGGFVLYRMVDHEPGETPAAWLRQNRTLVIATEGLFLALLLGWAVVRALNPDLTGTEKPMEMAFLNAVRRSAAFPPHDPWMSGYAISYYHFGYILMGTLANLSGVGSGIAFNLGIALLLGLVGIGALGVVYDLVVLRGRRFALATPEPSEAESDTADYRQFGQSDDPPPLKRKVDKVPAWKAIAAGLLAVFFITMMGNFGMAAVEMPLQAGLATNEYLGWIDLMHRPTVEDARPTGSLNVNDWNFWWWWAYSRVVYDRNLDGGGNEIITEFPNFSFILADMHPHVLSLPFVMLVAGLALNVVIIKRRWRAWEMLIYGILVGGMVFLNSWDAVFLVFFVGAEALRRLMWSGRGTLTGADWAGVGVFGVILFALTGLLYAPFFIGFRTQAGGPLPNVIWMTRFQQFLIMWLPFLLILGAFLFVEMRRAGRRFNGRLARSLLGWMALALFALVIVTGAAAWLSDDIRRIVYRITDQAGGVMTALADMLQRRVVGLPTTLLLLVIIFLVVARLFPREDKTKEPSGPAYFPSTGFALLLIGAGAALTLAPEFVYLRDGFGSRINTIFKLYYQTWLLWGLAAAYAVWSLVTETRGATRSLSILILVVVIATGALYPVFAIPTRAWKEGGHLAGYGGAMTLDGAPSLAAGMDDYTVIQCLARTATRDDDVVAEATKRGLAYNKDFGRVSGLTGIPTLLGWDNHEGQWRGSTFDDALIMEYVNDAGMWISEDRRDAIATLYNTLELNDALGVIERYGITYIYVGPTEQNQFSAEGLAKFAPLPPVCQSGNVAVYAADALYALRDSQ